MKEKMFLFVLIVCILAISSVLGGGQTAWAEASKIRICMATDTPTLDPHMHAEKVGVQLNMALFDPLFYLDRELKIIPMLATDHKVIDDTTVEVYLRKGVSFHNGEKFNAEIVKFNIERIQNPETKSPVRGKATWIKSVDIVDEFTVRFRLNAPYPIWQYQLTSLCMVPKQYLSEKGAEYFADHAVGTGPYKFVSWTRGSEIVLTANEEYYKGAPAIKELVWKVIPDASVQIASLISGDVDLVQFVNPENVPALEADPNIKVANKAELRFGWICLADALKPDSPLSDRRVRQAMNYAVDKKAIINDIIYGLGTQVTSLNTMHWGYDPSVDPYPHDLEKAKALMKEAGYPDGFKTILNMTPVNQVKGEEVHQAVQAMWAKIGVKARIQKWSGTGYMELVTSGKANPIYILNWGSFGIPDGDVILYPFFHSKGTYGNFWNSSETDRLIDIQHTSMDPKVRKEAMSKAQQIIREEAPWVFMFAYRSIDAWNKKFDFKARSDGRIYAYDIGLAK